MTTMTRTWWGKRFLLAVETYADPGRLARGRPFVRNGKILSHTVEPGRVTAQILGSINPYFGVNTEPTYTTTIEMRTLSLREWVHVIEDLAQKASFVTQLLLGEMPDSIDDAVAAMGVPFLPRGEGDVSSWCSCPDYENPCKHVAGLYYLMAFELDRDPLLLFELRGLPRDHLRHLLADSPLGHILVDEMTNEPPAIEPDPSYFARPVREQPPELSLRVFWEGAHHLPELSPAAHAGVTGLTARKHGDYPSFWNREGSFLEAIEAIYDRVRARSPEMK
jgi:uncharacterized Zn finger protein